MQKTWDRVQFMLDRKLQHPQAGAWERVNVF